MDAKAVEGRPAASVEDLVAVGRVVKPFGVRGEVRVESLSDVPGRIEGLTQVTLVSPNGRHLPTRVTGVRRIRDAYLVACQGLGSPEEAATWRGGFIMIPRDSSAPLPDDHYFESALIGMTVRLESGEIIGTVEEIWDLPANHVIVARQAGQETLIPALKSVVRSVDCAGRTMTVRLLDDAVAGPSERRHAV
jgi:16S rRNA processing protein RimM